MSQFRRFDLVQKYPSEENSTHLKTFLVTQPYAHAAIEAIIKDDGEIRSGCVNTLEGPDFSDPFYLYVPPAQVLEGFANGPLNLKDDLHTDGHDIALIDIVTYPAAESLISGFNVQTPGDLFKMNHNILVPYLDAIHDCGYLQTFVHTNTDPIDDAPTHNLFLPNRQKPGYRDALLRLRNALPSVFVVSEASPLMDDRYAYDVRDQRHGKPRQLSPISFSELEKRVVVK